MILPPGFERVQEGRSASVVRSDLRAWLLPLLRAAAGNLPAYEARALAGGRGGTLVVRAAEHDVVVRPYRRGGLAAWVLYDTYIGRSPRPFRELHTIETLRRRGAPVVEVYGAAIHWTRPGCYRGWLVTRYIAGAQTLWEWVSEARLPAAAPDERAGVFRRVGSALRQLHRCGGRHPDLNLNNILVCPPPSAGAVLFIDFDRPRLALRFGHPPEADLSRLERSARKLDRDGRHVTPADLAALRAAYWENGT